MQDIKIVISEYAYVCVSEKKSAAHLFGQAAKHFFSTSEFCLCNARDNLKAGNWFKENIFKSEAFYN